MSTNTTITFNDVDRAYRKVMEQLVDDPEWNRVIDLYARQSLNIPLDQDDLEDRMDYWNILALLQYQATSKYLVDSYTMAFEKP